MEPAGLVNGEGPAAEVGEAAVEEVEYTIVIVGGGPQGLAVLSALHEWYSFAELGMHRDSDYRFRMGTTKKFKKVGKVCVVDPAGRFMAQWDRQFHALEITHLRSPVFAHPDAYDEEAMLVYAVHNDRSAEIHNAPMARAGKGRGTKNARDVGRAAMGLEGLPSTSLFSDFCQALAGRHAHTWVQGAATDVEKRADGTGYTVTVGGTRRLKCDAVVLALGPVGAPRIPRAFQGAKCPNIVHTDALFSGAGSGNTLRDIVHHRVASATAASGLSTVLVIGGGLCAAQAALAAHKAGALVTLRSRRKLLTKDYDLNRDWLNFKKFNRLKHDFLAKPLEERPAELAAAVDGGSVPTAYMQALERLSGPGSSLQIEVDPGIDGSKLEVGTDGTVAVGGARFALVILATGTTLAPLSNPLFANLHAKIPARFIGTLPVLTPSLRWVETEKIFVVGAPGALEIGPGALNLMGGKRAGQLVADDLQDLMYARPKKVEVGQQKMLRNAFSLLDIGSSSESESESGSSSSFGSGSSSDNANDDDIDD